MRPETLAQVDTLLRNLHSTAEMIRNDTDVVAAHGDHIEVIKHYDRLRRVTENIKEAREALSQMEEHLSRETVPEVMRLAKVRTITVEGVGRVTVSHKYSCSMLDKQLGMDYLREIGQGGMIQPTVNAQTLASFAKNRLEVDGKEMPPELFKVGTMAYTSIRKVQ